MMLTSSLLLSTHSFDIRLVSMFPYLFLYTLFANVSVCVRFMTCFTLFHLIFLIFVSFFFLFINCKTSCTIHIFSQSSNVYFLSVQTFSFSPALLPTVRLLFRSVWDILTIETILSKQERKKKKRRCVACVAFAITASMVFICLFISFFAFD